MKRALELTPNGHVGCLALLLDASLKATILPAKDAGDILFDTVRLLDQRCGAFMGFYDWLRKRSLPKRVLGVRFWPHESSHLPSDVLSGKPYISTTHNHKRIEIWFGPDRSYDKEMSGDQSFGFNRVLIASNNTQTALVLDTYDLSPEEFDSVRTILNVPDVAPPITAWT
jgi:hypothetical protein